jgi:hypothetical protein
MDGMTINHIVSIDHGSHHEVKQICVELATAKMRLEPPEDTATFQGPAQACLACFVFASGL